MKRALFTLIAAFATLTFGSAQLRADFIPTYTADGQTINPTTGVAVGSTDVNGMTGFFIPLSDPAGARTFGVDGVGLSADTGNGFGYDLDPAAMKMFIEFDISSFFTPLDAAELQFVFDDLDLIGVNDPENFFESARFHVGSGTDLVDLQALTGVVKNVTDDISSAPSIADISGEIEHGGSNDLLTVSFSGDGLVNLISTILDNPGIDQADKRLYAMVEFGSQFNTTGKNTEEKALFATLALESAQQIPVPEPSSLALLGLGVAGMFGFGIRRRRTDGIPAA